jgi:hypothetical protein
MPQQSHPVQQVDVLRITERAMAKVMLNGSGYRGHSSIASTVRYTGLAPDRFKGFWKD